jgi:hypothetical protein
LAQLKSECTWRCTAWSDEPGSGIIWARWELGRGSADRDVLGGHFSSRRVEDITEALWGTRVSPSTVSNLNKKIYAKNLVPFFTGCAVFVTILQRLPKI